MEKSCMPHLEAYKVMKRPYRKKDRKKTERERHPQNLYKDEEKIKPSNQSLDQMLRVNSYFNIKQM